METTLKKKPTARKTRLGDGQNSIERSNPRIRGNSKVLDWKIRLPGHAEVKPMRTQGAKNITDGELRANALARAKELLAIDSSPATYKKTTSIRRYMNERVLPEVKVAPLSERTKEAYAASAGLILGDCDAHEHKYGLGSLHIASAITFPRLVRLLQEIAQLHGAETARRARTFATGHLIKQLMLEPGTLIDRNPLLGATIDLKHGAREYTGRTGGVALTEDEYDKALSYLLNLDPAAGVEKPKRGRWTIEDRIQKRRNAIDLTLLQAATGLRVNEARLLLRNLVNDDGKSLRLTVSKDIAKGGVGRISHVLDSRVADHLRKRLTGPLEPTHPVIGSPYDSSVPWDLSNLTDTLRELYLELRKELQIDAFEKERSHIWRATLNTILQGTVPEAMRAAQFGHTIDVNRAHYLDDALTSEAIEAAQLKLSSK